MFNRNIAVQVGTIRISASNTNEAPKTSAMLRVVFKVDKGLNQEPNKSELSIYNLSAEHRRQLQKTMPLIIEAGYAGNSSIIFQGKIAYLSNVREDTDWVTKIHCGDGQNEYIKARFAKSYGANTSVKQVLIDVVGALGVGVGNALEKIAGMKAREGFDRFTKGVTVNGRVADLLQKYVSSCGLTWSIQNEQLQILEPGQSTTDPAIKLSAATGMIGSPEYGEKKGDQTVMLRVRSLLNGGLYPGRAIFVAAAALEGYFRVNHVVHSGDTWGPEWTSDIEASAL